MHHLLVILTEGTIAAKFINYHLFFLWARISDSNCSYRYHFLFSNLCFPHCSFFSMISWRKRNLACRFYISITVTVAFLILRNFICIIVTISVTTKYSRNLICNDCSWSPPQLKCTKGPVQTAQRLLDSQSTAHAKMYKHEL